jgi:hypothetical protein
LVALGRQVDVESCGWGMEGIQGRVTPPHKLTDKHNDNPKPFVWTAKASDILEKVKRARAVLDNR